LAYALLLNLDVQTTSFLETAMVQLSLQESPFEDLDALISAEHGVDIHAVRAILIAVEQIGVEHFGPILELVKSHQSLLGEVVTAFPQHFLHRCGANNNWRMAAISVDAKVL
jgi:hypothetical protein